MTPSSGTGPAPMVIRVLVAEDMQILRDTLVAVLNLEDDIDVDFRLTNLLRQVCG